MWMIVILSAVAFCTAALSGMIGMGGGILLLAAMFSVMPHNEAIPAHGTVQLVSNSTRTVAFLPHVDWPVFGRFVLGALPGSVLGVLVLRAVGQLDHAEPWLKVLVGAYILASLVLPKPKRRAAAGHWWEFPLMGLLAGTAALTVGAVGPLIAPLFARREFVKERLVATKAVCQSLLHLTKIPAFLMLREYPDLTTLGMMAVLMGLVTIPGTLAGKRLLRDLPERHFVVLFRCALLAAGLKVLLVDGLWPLLTVGTRPV